MSPLFVAVYLPLSNPYTSQPSEWSFPFRNFMMSFSIACFPFCPPSTANVIPSRTPTGGVTSRLSCAVPGATGYVIARRSIREMNVEYGCFMFRPFHGGVTYYFVAGSESPSRAERPSRIVDFEFNITDPAFGCKKRVKKRTEIGRGLIECIIALLSQNVKNRGKFII